MCAEAVLTWKVVVGTDHLDKRSVTCEYCSAVLLRDD